MPEARKEDRNYQLEDTPREASVPLSHFVIRRAVVTLALFLKSGSCPQNPKRHSAEIVTGEVLRQGTTRRHGQGVDSVM
jgi:hypothetical protein